MFHLFEIALLHLQGNDRRNVFAKLAVLQFIYEDKEASTKTIAKLLSLDSTPMSFIVLGQAFASFGKQEQARLILRQGMQKYPHAKEFKDIVKSEVFDQ